MIILPSFLTDEFVILDPSKITSLSVQTQHRYIGDTIKSSVIIEIRLGTDVRCITSYIEHIDKIKEFFSELLLTSKVDIKD